MADNKKRFRIDFTVDTEGWSDDFIKDSAIQELTCMVPYPEDITFSEVSTPWHTGTPTNGGLYFVYDKYCGYGKRELKKDISEEQLKVAFHDVLAWIPIEPYKED